MLSAVVYGGEKSVAAVEDDSENVDNEFLGGDALWIGPRLALEGELEKVLGGMFAHAGDEVLLVKKTTEVGGGARGEAIEPEQV